MIACVLFVLLVLPAVAPAQCSDELLLDGSEQLIEAGLDTTGLWWALVAPYAGQQRLIVGGYRTAAYDRILPPVLSRDGNHWATWAQRAGMWQLLVDTTALPAQCVSPGILAFAPNAPVLVASCYDGSVEVIAHGNAQYTVFRRVGDVALSPDGSHLAWVEQVQAQQRLMLDGREIVTGDAIRLGGFWQNGQLLYAYRAGAQWRLFRGTEELAGPFTDVGHVVVNRFGTAAVVHVHQQPWQQILLISDDFARPLPSQQYDSIWSVVCHPYLPQYGAVAVRQNTYFLLHTGTEYGVGRYPLGELTFTPDGSELYAIGCDVDCFLMLDGRRYPLGQDLSTALVVARRPHSQTFAYSTPTNLFVRRIDKAAFTYSRMCDAVLPAVYNRRRNRYEALGIVQGRLYLLFCP